MQKFNEVLLDNLKEMEFLNQILESAYLHYCHYNQNLSQIVKKAQFCLTNAILDLAIDVDYKINRHINNDKFVQKAIENLQNAEITLSLIPDNDVIDFDNTQQDIEHLIHFVQQYAINGYILATDLNPEERQQLNHKILTIRGKRLI